VLGVSVLFGGVAWRGNCSSDDVLPCPQALLGRE